MEQNPEENSNPKDSEKDQKVMRGEVEIRMQVCDNPRHRGCNLCVGKEYNKEVLKKLSKKWRKVCRKLILQRKARE